MYIEEDTKKIEFLPFSIFGAKIRQSTMRISLRDESSISYRINLTIFSIRRKLFPTRKQIL